MCARPANPELRAEILKAAAKIIEECGADCVTMRQVAEEVGYTPTTLYLYFKDKDAILMEVMTIAYEDLADFVAMAEVGPTFVDRLRQRGRAYIVWGLLHPALYALMFETRHEAQTTPEQDARAFRGPAESWKAMERAVEAGELSGIDDLASFGMLLWAALHGVTSLAIAGRLSAAAAKATPAELVAEATAMGDQIVNCMLVPHEAAARAARATGS